MTPLLGGVLVEVVTRVPAILLLAWQVGNIFQRYRLPRISGYLATGVVSGQHVLGRALLKLFFPLNFSLIRAPLSHEVGCLQWFLGQRRLTTQS